MPNHDSKDIEINESSTYRSLREKTATELSLNPHDYVTEDISDEERLVLADYFKGRTQVSFKKEIKSTSKRDIGQNDRTRDLSRHFLAL